MTSDRQLAFLALSIFAGVMFPQLAYQCKPLLLPTIFLLFLFAIYQVRFRDVVRAMATNRNGWVVIVWQLVVLPLVAVVVIKPLLPVELYVFSVVALCAGSITATTALAKIFSLNDALALAVCVVGTILMPVPLFLVLNYALGVEVAIQGSVYLERILVFIVVPFIVVAVLRTILPSTVQQSLVTHTPVIVLGLLMLFGLCVMDGVRQMMHDAPLILLQFVLLAFAISLLTQFVTWIALRFMGGRDVKTACLVCAYRNMGMVAAITGTALGDNFLIFVGMWQLPMYLLPLLLKRFYRWSPA